MSVLILTTAAACATASHTLAAIVTWEFEGVVRGTDGTPSLPGQDWVFFEGQVFSGSLSFDTDVPASGGSLLSFADPVVELHISFPALGPAFPEGPPPEGPFDLVPTSSPAGSFAFLRDDPAVDVLAFVITPAASPLLTGIDGVQLGLVRTPGAPPSGSTTLPASPPPLSELLPFEPGWADLSPIARTGLFFTVSGSDYQVGAELTSLHAVPEPALWLLSAPALALTCLRRRSRGSIAA